MGSANTQLSILRRKKILASINKSKIELATQPLPNAKRWLFGDDFPSIASKEAELSRGLAKNLAPSGSKFNVQDPKRQSGNFNPGNFNSASKYRAQTKRGRFFRPPSFSPPAAAKLPHHIKQWQSLTSDPSILEIVTGLKIPFRSVPVQKTPQISQTYLESETLMDKEISKLLAKGPICEVPFTTNAFYSQIFLVPKNDGDMRPVIDLSTLNQYIEPQHFQMEHLCSIKTLLQQGYYMTKLDLKDTYLSVPIHPDSQKYLRFLWKNKTYQFKALPFGLNIAPMIFTRLMKPVAGFLRKQGVRLIVYLDDMLTIPQRWHMSTTKEGLIRYHY